MVAKSNIIFYFQITVFFPFHLFPDIIGNFLYNNYTARGKTLASPTVNVTHHEKSIVPTNSNALLPKAFISVLTPTYYFLRLHKAQISYLLCLPPINSLKCCWVELHSGKKLPSKFLQCFCVLLLH